jgi:hypothetical protein
MLWKALQYFAVTWWDPRIRNRITYIDGETYWAYRLYAEGYLFALASIGCFATALYNEPAETTSGFLVAAVVLAVVGLLEVLRLRKQLREQVIFAEQFYG